MPKISIMVTGFILMLSMAAAQAEVISIADPRYDVPNNSAGVIRPTQGMNMSQVEQKFGQPTEKFPAVGEPPISRWQYGEFDVFFEYDKVIHSVINR
ncbi:hypothetical protein [Methylophaga sp.]|uniref:hypothetical protein n=1 Tax=Methylophaga sp. TaxID=2024840 RepID=UPI003F69D5B9